MLGSHTRPYLDIPGLTQTFGDGYRPEAPAKKPTQHEQDEADDKARRRAMNDLVQSWMDRLQLISLITTFLASVEAGMLQVTKSDDENVSGLEQATNASLLSALVLHLYASFISFFAAFFLIRYKVKEAKREEAKVESSTNGNSSTSGSGPPPQSKGSILIDMAAKHVTGSPETLSPKSTVTSTETSKEGKVEVGANSEAQQNAQVHPPQLPPPAIWSADPHLQLVRAGPFQRQPPIALLSRCHSLCLLFATLGFLLALAGIMLYSWTQQTAVKAVTTGVLGLGILSGAAISTARIKDHTELTTIHE
ncbi:hypothetical protein D9758_006758 [Tetrapyrgos nigripes]|uniref:Transmembrane protein n=1 Tax=Tetrapyrgos nigripes TaxID=182062 RepID=A0A8H5FT42_9AGAR|nr:hypothetical protein D9758_006758 [Tetrapyrgos nigripes]